jgi:hypothetical protein
MKIEKKHRDFILDKIRGAENITAKEVADIIKIYGPAPDVERLIENEYKATARKLLASTKDDNGLRECFAVKEITGKVVYVNIAKTKNSSDLDKVTAALAKQYRGLNKSMKKIELRKKVLNGQMTLEEYKEAL